MPNLLENFINATDNTDEINNQGFTVPNAPAADGIGLPFTQIPPGVSAAQPVRRHLINWLIPQMGLVTMYVNPENISYSFNKIIRPSMTKGGYTVQYWGEDLIKINMSGTTGSSGIEGINVLYEVYRSEQYTFDSVGLSLASGNAASNAAGGILGTAASITSAGLGAVGGGLGGLIGGETGSAIGSSLIQGLFGMDNNLAPRNIPSLAQSALTVEMYYNGWVYRGYFDNMNIRESTDLLFNYTINFTATQRRGYRTNFLPWHKSPAQGGGVNSNDTVIDPITGKENGVPYSFNGKFTNR